jgi:hypothetical protein
MNNKIRTLLIDDTNIIYVIRLDNDKIIIIHNNDKTTEVISDYDFYQRYKTHY